MARQRINGAESDDDGSGSGDNVVIIAGDGSISEDRNEDDGNSIPVFEPTAFVIEPSESDQPRRRGRKPGSKNASRTQPQKEVAQDLTGVLLSVHFMLSKLVKIDELQLDEEEAKKLGDAVARVNKEFGVQMMSPKMAAIVNLGIVGAGVYGPRVIAITHNAKVKKEKAASASKVSQVVM